MAAANFELGIGDGRHQKKRNASHNFGPKCKATLFALTIIFASVALNSIYMEARLGQIEKRLVKDFERRLDEIKQSFEIDITAETVSDVLDNYNFLKSTTGKPVTESFLQ